MIKAPHKTICPTYDHGLTAGGNSPAAAISAMKAAYGATNAVVGERKNRIGAEKICASLSK